MSFDLDLKFSNHPRVGSGEKGIGKRGWGLGEGKKEKENGRRGRKVGEKERGERYIKVLGP